MKNDNREWVTSGGLRGGAVAQSGGRAGACAGAQWLRAADERGLARGRNGTERRTSGGLRGGAVARSGGRARARRGSSRPEVIDIFIV